MTDLVSDEVSLDSATRHEKLAANTIFSPRRRVAERSTDHPNFDSPNPRPGGRLDGRRRRSRCPFLFMDTLTNGRQMMKISSLVIVLCFAQLSQAAVVDDERLAAKLRKGDPATLAVFPARVSRRRCWFR
jgi:hypothetical protein